MRNRSPIPAPAVPVFAAAALAAVAAVAMADEARVPIHSRSVDFDYKNGITHYSGGVTVDIPNVLQLACEDLVAVQAAGTNRLESLTATTNVVLKVARPARNPGDAPVLITATGDVAVFTATNNLVTLTGPWGNTPRVETAQFKTRADVIRYDLATGRVVGLSNHVTEINPDLFRNSGLFNRTNRPARKESP
jgi:lipopolysaccharide export system protein LptA